ncbi:hypothetical protein RRG08_043790 [Elysia crispata]|uniref:Uncharacterized protein n=1 Tax=Elysia crispata TaxID=231223 RepID=A0AAE0Z4N3_9GAST|nr:hypothetical protein RRG08_043790 [Elysia crispata]
MGTLGQLDNGTSDFYNKGFTSLQAELTSLPGTRPAGQWNLRFFTTRALLHHRPDCPSGGKTRTAAQWNLCSLQPGLHFTTGRTVQLVGRLGQPTLFTTRCAARRGKTPHRETRFYDPHTCACSSAEPVNDATDSETEADSILDLIVKESTEGRGDVLQLQKKMTLAMAK